MTFLVASLTTELNVRTLFWVPFALFVGAFQVLVGVQTDAEGFSLIWCALFGSMLHEELRSNLFSHSGTLVRCLAAGTTLLVALALIIYGIEESMLLPEQRPSHRRPCAECCWDRTGSSTMHAATLLVGVAVGAAAHAWPLGVVITICVAAVVTGVAATRVGLRRRARAALAARAGQRGRATEEDLAIAQLESQLLRTREKAAMLRHKLQQQPPTALLPAPSAAGLGPTAPLAAEVHGAEPARRQGEVAEREAHPHTHARADAGAGADVDAWLQELAQLERRERQLLDRLETRRDASLKSEQAGPPGAPGPGLSTARSTGSDELVC